MSTDMWIMLGAYVALILFVLVLAWRFVKAHETIAGAMQRFAHAQQEAAQSLRELVVLKSKEEKQP